MADNMHNYFCYGILNACGIVPNILGIESRKEKRFILTNGPFFYEIFLKVRGKSGRLRIRTADPLLVRQTL